MKEIKGTGIGKRLCCWLLTGILLTGQGSSPAYAEESIPPLETESDAAQEMESDAAQEMESNAAQETENDTAQENDVFQENDIPQEDDISQEADVYLEKNMKASNPGETGSTRGTPLPDGSEFDAEGLHWKVTASSTNDSLTCTGPATGTTVSGKLEIPLHVVYQDYVYWVPFIAPGAFKDCTELTELEILNRSELSGTICNFNLGEQSLSDAGPFEGCTKLQKVTLPNTCQSLGNCAFKGCTSLEAFEITAPENDYIQGSLMTIRSSAFEGCTSLREISLGHCKSLYYIGSSSFKGCTSLEKVTLPENLRNIYGSAFQGCSSLESILLPSGLNTLEQQAFKDCVKLKSIKIPSGVEALKSGAFEGCSSLVEAELSDKTAIVGSKYTGQNVFNGCTMLKTLKIDTTAPAEGASYGTPDVKNNNSFGTLPTDRKVVFLNFDGTAVLSGSDLMAAQAAYRAVNDGDTTDDYWYGWEIGTIDMYPVVLTVNKDDAAWPDSGKSFSLSADGVNFIPYVAGNTYVPEGTYQVYEVTESGQTDTQLDVTVDKDHTTGTATVNYYTVTFYQDSEDKVPYRADTDQKPQIVLKGTGAAQPADPAAEEGYVFSCWMEEITGELQRFDFVHTMINGTTDLYAYWSSVYYTIEVSANAGGSISPGTNVNVRYGEDQSFVITPDRNYHIKEIRIDGTALEVTDLAQKDAYTYTFSEVKANHKIVVTFEADPEDIKPEEPDKPDTSDPSDKPENPTTPGNTDQPEVPTTPGTSDQPEVPTTPGNTDQPETPATPGNTDQPQNPAAPGTTDTSDSGNAPQNPDVAAPDSTATAHPPVNSGNPAASSSEGSQQNRQPKTGDDAPVEMYATLAMIAGLTEVMLYFGRYKKGMTEARKKELVSMLVSWAKGRGRLRRYAALAAIFGLLLYYHSIGKHMSDEWKEFCGA